MQEVNDKIEKDCPLLGRRVVLCGLADKARDAPAGTAIDFAKTERNERDTLWLEESGRYTVRLDGKGERLVKARVEEVEEAEEDWTVGMGGGGGGGGRGGRGGGGSGLHATSKGKGEGKGKGKALSLGLE